MEKFSSISLAMFLVLSILFSLVACGDGGASPETTPSPERQPTETPETVNPTDPEPVLEPELVQITQFKYYSGFKAIDIDGNLWGWGPNNHGQVGNGTIDAVDQPFLILDNVESIYGGMFALRTDGSLWGWGENRFGMLGVGTTENQLSPVHIMDDVASFIPISIPTEREGYPGSVMVIQTDGSLWAWGLNRVGQLGDGTKENRQSPVHIADNVKELLSHGAFIKTDNSLWVFGENTPNDSLIPYHVMDDVDTVKFSPFGSIDSILKTDGTVWTLWGFLEDTRHQFTIRVFE
jgi:alpha-tubulin suppressor-like RCC1 family protein